MKDTVVINDKNVEVEVTAYTMLIYEDTFKGHGFLRDADRIIVKNLNDVKFGSAVKLLWAAAKTADDTIPNFKTWAKEISIKDAISATDTIINLIVDSLKSDSPKVTATATAT